MFTVSVKNNLVEIDNLTGFHTLKGARYAAQQESKRYGLGTFVEIRDEDGILEVWERNKTLPIRKYLINEIRQKTNTKEQSLPFM